MSALNNVNKTDTTAGSWGKFGLSRHPFDDAQHVYYPVDHWEEHMRYLQRFPAGPYPLLLIPGIVGCGKSTLLKRFMDEQDQPARFHYLRAEAQHSMSQLIFALYQNTGLPPRCQANLPDLLSQLAGLADSCGTQMLLIDDAHRLSRETLIRLLHLLFEQDVSKSKLHVVLCGEPQLQEKVIGLLGEFAPGRQVPCIELESLSLQQSREYLEYRLSQAGLTGKFPFNNQMLKQVHALSGGFPGRINRVAQQVLLDATKSHTQGKGTFNVVNEYLGENKIKLMSAVLLVATGVLLWQLQPFNRAILQPVKMQAALHVKPIAKQHFAAIDQLEAPANPKAEKMTVRQAILAAMEHLEAQEAKTQADSNAYRTLALQQRPHYGQDDMPQFASKDAPKLNDVAQAVTKSVTKYSSQEQILLSKRGYTLQLMAARDPEGLEDLVERHDLKNATYYRTHLKGKDWYVLVYGHYKTPGAAIAALEALPEEIQATQPWVRSLSSVHAAIQSKTHLATNMEDNDQG